jgi:hypothetical protein
MPSPENPTGHWGYISGMVTDPACRRQGHARVERDRKTKPQRYAEAGIQHFWRIEKETGLPVIHVFELEQATGSYVPTGIVRDRLKLDVPFPMDIDVKALSH